MQLWHVTTAKKTSEEWKGKGRKQKKGNPRRFNRLRRLARDRPHYSERSLKRIDDYAYGGRWLRLRVMTLHIHFEWELLNRTVLPTWARECDWHSGCGSLMMPQINCSATSRSLALSAIATQLRESNLFDILPGTDGKLFCVLDQKLRINVIVNSTPRTLFYGKLSIAIGSQFNSLSRTFARPFRVMLQSYDQAVLPRFAHHDFDYLETLFHFFSS